MRVATNTPLINNRQRIARIMAFAGLGILLLGLVLSFNPGTILYSYIALIIGILISSVGTYNATKWLAPPLAQDTLNETLKGFDNKNKIYNYLLPAEHVLLTPQGVFVLTVKRTENQVRYDGQRWHNKMSLFRRFQNLSRERLGDPVQESNQDVSAVKQLISSNLNDASVPVEGMIVFINPNVETLLEADPPVSTLHVKQLKNYLRKRLKELPPTPEEERKQVEDLFDSLTEKKIGSTGTES
ncbi:MAG: NERD domain-containing protein [Chloroflexi bacterium]|nr:NERD domain-containing protein [Chloroflexota bacterium]